MKLYIVARASEDRFDEFGVRCSVRRVLDVIETRPMGSVPMMVAGGTGKEFEPARVVLGEDGHVYVKPPVVDYSGSRHWIDRTQARPPFATAVDRLSGIERYVDADGHPIRHPDADGHPIRHPETL